MDDCLFCKIVEGEISATVVYEDDNVLAFKDINPQMPVHILIIPKVHYASIADEIPDEELGNLMNTVKKVAQIQGIEKSGYRVIINTGNDAQQTVHHVHVHVLGGEAMNSGSPRRTAV